MKNSRVSPVFLTACMLVCASCAALAQNFGSVKIGESSTATITVPIATAGTVGSISVRLLGAENLDFTNAGGGTCAVGTAYAAKATCTVKVKFAPKYAGARNGAVVLFSGAGSTGAVLADTPINGTGSGPQIGFRPATAIANDPIAFDILLTSPLSVAVDGAGDLFVSGFYHQGLVEVPAGGAPVEIAPFVDGIVLGYCNGVAVDGAGNLFAADYQNLRVVEVPTGGGPAISVPTTADGKGLNFPEGLAVDAVGDLFIADYYNDRVLKVPQGGGATTVVDVPPINGLGLTYPVGLAVDVAGDLFITDDYTSRVLEVPQGGGATTVVDVPPINGLGLNNPVGLAVDGAGDLFIAYNADGVAEVPADGSAPFFIYRGGSDGLLSYPWGVAVDGAGDIFITVEYGSGMEFQSSQPPAQSFANTLPGATSTDSPRTVQVWNIGNQPLAFTGVSYPVDFPEASGDSIACTPSTTLSPGQPCDLPVDFTPLVLGPLSGNVTITDNSLNKVGSTQEIPVSGTGFSAQSITFGALPNVVLGVAPVTLTAIASSGLAVSYAVTGPATISGSILTITGGGTVSVTASQAGDSSYGPATPVTRTFFVFLPSTVKVLSSDLNPTVGWPVTFTATVNFSGGPIPTGTVTFFAGATSLGSETLLSGPTGAVAAMTTSALGIGGYTITAKYSGDTVYAEAISGSIPESVVSTPSLTLTAVPNPAGAYAPFTVTATVEYPSGGPVPTGTMLFYLDKQHLGVSALSGGVATWQIGGLAPGAHALGAQYGGDSHYRGIGGAGVFEDLSKETTSVALSASPNPAAVGAQLTVTATVATTLAGKTPTGSVKFYLDQAGLGVVPLVNGVATYQTSSLTAGTHRFVVQYGGDPNYDGGDSAPVWVTVQ